MRFTVIAIMSAALCQLGCYNTVVRSGAVPAGPSHQDRQWFALGGIVDLSEPSGDDCGPAGVAQAESRQSGLDMLISVGLALAGGSAGLALCDDTGDPEAYASCVSASASLPPFLIGSRTVKYRCAAGSGAITPVPGG